MNDLYQFATVRQIDYLQAIEKHGSQPKAARALGINLRTLEKSLARLKARAAQQLASEHDYASKPVPEGYSIRGVSQYIDAETGQVKGQWIKTGTDDQRRMELLKEAVASFIADIEPIKVKPAPLDFQSDVIPWIQIGDAHIGMLAHAAETTENFDLKIAERELCGAIGILIDEMPACERIVINDLGDATHYDNLSATTAASNHALDADGRHPKMLRVYSRVMRFIVDKVLEKAKFVDVIVNQGNHSRINDFWMAELLRVAYGHTGRVTVLDNDSVFIPYRMGKTLVMVHHSDKCPPARLVGVMTSDYRKDFGETDHHYIDIGHVHHHFVSKEHPSVIIESWNHLAANDKWAHESGYRARKSISVVLRSKTYGDVGRRVLPIDEIRDKLKKVGSKPADRKEVYSV